MNFKICNTLLFSLSLGVTALMSSCDSYKKAVDSNPTELAVLSYNIHHANPPSKPDFIDIDAICKVIKDADVDIIALQEVDVNTSRSAGFNQAKEIAKQLNMSYRFYKAIDFEDGSYGIAIMSRLPIRNAKTVKLPQVEKAENRILALLEVKINGQWVSVINTHLDSSKGHANRNTQMAYLVDLAEKNNNPTILCGDLNSWPNSEAIKILDKSFKRTCLKDCEPTVPQVKPRNVIDYIATKNFPWNQKSITVIQEEYASDHRPVKVVFALN